MITEGFELADYACSSANSRGRAIEEKEQYVAYRVSA